jgi:geranylgeranyl diphosphate synthase type I
MTSTLTTGMLEAIEAELRKSLDDLDPGREPELVRMVRYHFGWTEPRPESGGKRLRPLLTLLTCAAAGGEWERALPAAAAVELVHNFTLIHDDIEDRSEYRRGRRTVWVEWGVPQAINTGDAVYVLSHRAASRLQVHGFEPALIERVHEALDRSCLELTRGQHLDIAFEDQADVSLEAYLQMIEGKTGALISAAAVVGAYLAGAEDHRAEAFRSYGMHVGLAFQMLDDVLGVWGSSDETGKASGDDLRARKKSLPVVLGMAESAEFRRRWGEDSRDEGAVRAMVRLLEQAGVRTRAWELAEGHTRQALEALGRAFPGEPAASELEALAARLLHRTG